MKTHSLIITLCVLIVGCTARNLGKRSHKEEYIRLMRSMDRYDVFHEECEFAREDRQECGKRTYDETECKLRGCCFEICEGCDAQIPWCFLAKRMINDEQCDVAYEDKDDCGYYGITEQECVQVRECCWRPSPAANDPPCFRRKPELTVRLVNGEETDTSLSGRVEVKYQGEWGTVCDDNFDQNAADVVCRSLGYEFAIPKGYAEYGEGTGNIWLDGLRCRGNEERIEDCSHNGWGSHDCGHYEDAGAICSHTEYNYGYYPYYYYPYYYPYYYYYDYSDEEDYYYNLNDDGDDDDDLAWYRLDGSKKQPEKKQLAAHLKAKGVKGPEHLSKRFKLANGQPKNDHVAKRFKFVDGQPKKQNVAKRFKLADGQPRKDVVAKRFKQLDDSPSRNDNVAANKQGKAQLHKRMPVTHNQLRKLREKVDHKKEQEKVESDIDIVTRLEEAHQEARAMSLKAKQEAGKKLH